MVDYEVRLSGKAALVTLIDMPLAVSPVVAGLIYILIFGRNGYLGPTVDSLGIDVVFAFPGIAIALTVLSLVFLGDWLRDRLDPTLRNLE